VNASLAEPLLYAPGQEWREPTLAEMIGLLALDPAHNVRRRSSITAGIDLF
jgi:hypothetical protein